MGGFTETHDPSYDGKTSCDVRLGDGNNYRNEAESRAAEMKMLCFKHGVIRIYKLYIIRNSFTCERLHVAPVESKDKIGFYGHVKRRDWR